MAEAQRIKARWKGESCIVAAPGPSLTSEVVRQVRLKRWLDKWDVIAVADAYREMMWADVVYGCDNAWWDIHQTCNGFRGERWSCHEQYPHELHGNDKRHAADAYGINIVQGRDGDEFSFDPSFIRYGSNAGFQAINLALLFGCTQIVLVGFDMRYVDGKSHFFGDHPEGLRLTRDEEYQGFVKHYERAAKRLPNGIRIVNATPNSALRCFEMKSLDEAFRSMPNTHAIAV